MRRPPNVRVDRLKKSFSVAAVTLVAAGVTAAADTGTISGLVTDRNGGPVSGALVAVKDVSCFATSNADGYYVITPVPVGTYEVKVSRAGLGEQVRTGVKVVAGLRVNASFQLISSYHSGYIVGERPVPWDDTFYRIQDLLLRYREPRTQVVEEFDRPLVRPRGVVGENGDNPEGPYDSQVIDEFADMLVRTPGIVYEDDNASTLNLHIRGDVEEAGAAGDAATGTISGSVSDRGWRPLVGASVEVAGTDLSATTDYKGYYRINRVPAGLYDVKATAADYGEQVETGVDVTAYGGTHVSFQLQ
jgi:hypothetical protein